MAKRRKSSDNTKVGRIKDHFHQFPEMKPMARSAALEELHGGTFDPGHISTTLSFYKKSKAFEQRVSRESEAGDDARKEATKSLNGDAGAHIVRADIKEITTITEDNARDVIMAMPADQARMLAFDMFQRHMRMAQTAQEQQSLAVQMRKMNQSLLSMVVPG